MLITVGTSFHAALRAHSLDMDAAYEVAGQRGNWFFDTFLSRPESPALPPRLLASSRAHALTVHLGAGDRDHHQQVIEPGEVIGVYPTPQDQDVGVEHSLGWASAGLS